MGVRRVVARVGFVYVRLGCRRATEQSNGLHFVVVCRDGDYRRCRRCRRVAFFPPRRQPIAIAIAIAEQLRVDAEYERGVDRLARAADLGGVLVQRVEVLQDVVERALGDVFPFILSLSGREAERRREGGDTDDEKHVGVLRLHSRGDARVFVAREVLRVDHGDDCV
jgi:hypothetical protein